MFVRPSVWLAGLALLCASQANAESDRAASGLARALRDGDFDLSLSYRYELVDQDSFALDGGASLLKTRLRFQSADLSGLTLSLEVDDVRGVGADGYNSTRNGKVERPVVADPTATELNALLLSYHNETGMRLALGRQGLSFSSRRFLGSNNWRLNEQTFDSLAVLHEFTAGFEAGYTYIANVNRVFGPDPGVPSADLRGRMHLIDGKYALGADVRLHGYAYLFDFDDAAEFSSATVGLRVAGSGTLGARVSLPYALEYARQRDHADNPVAYDADYIVLEAGLSWPALRMIGRLEILEGNGAPGGAMTTPLAGLHGYNGWADQFLAIPADGLEDLSLGLAASLGGGELDVVFHDFTSSRGRSSFGRELDAVFRWPFAERYTLVLKAADYHAGAHAADTRKLWLMLSATF